MMPKQCRLAEFYKKSENPPDESLMVTFVTQSITSECDNFLNKIADLRTEADDKGVPLTWDKLLKSLETKAKAFALLPDVPSPDLVPGYYAVHLLPVFFVPRTIVLHIFFLYPILLIALITNIRLSVVVRRAICRWCRVSVINCRRESTSISSKKTCDVNSRFRREFTSSISASSF